MLDCVGATYGVYANDFDKMHILVPVPYFPPIIEVSMLISCVGIIWS